MAATEALPSFDPMPGVWPRYHGKSFFLHVGFCLPPTQERYWGSQWGRARGFQQPSVMFCFSSTPLLAQLHTVCAFTEGQASETSGC